MSKTITVEITVNASIEKAWHVWTDPEYITKWAFASDDWEAPHAENDLRTGGKFLTHMGAKDKSVEFDFSGTYTEVIPNETISYLMDDGRTAHIVFEKISEDVTKITETFEMENENPEEMQRGGWLAILNNFKKAAENA